MEELSMNESGIHLGMFSGFVTHDFLASDDILTRDIHTLAAVHFSHSHFSLHLRQQAITSIPLYFQFFLSFHNSTLQAICANGSFSCFIILLNFYNTTTILYILKAVFFFTWDLALNP